MALTNFTALTSEQKKVWSLDVWKEARNKSFAMGFTGTSEDSMIQRITELTKSEKGDQAVITLVADLEGDGVVGDNVLWDKEEAIKAYDQVVTIDQIRNANRTAGRMSEQKSVVKFRETSKNVLGYWLGDRIDQMSFLTLSGISYTLATNGALRPVLGGGTAGQNLSELAFAADVTAPTANRHYRWDAIDGLVAADTTAVEAADTPTYAMLVEMRAKAKDSGIKPIRMDGNREVYHVFMHPLAMAKLKLDDDYKQAMRNAGVRGDQNEIFKGGVPTIDGLVIHEFRHVFNTKGATTGTAAEAGVDGYKWGATAAVDGTRTLLCGAQSLAMADLGTPYWDEEDWDYKNQYGISIGKILGLLKPVFPSIYTGSDEDFSVMCIDHAL